MNRRHSIQRDLDQERRRRVICAAAQRKRELAESVRAIQDEHAFKDLQAELRAEHPAGGANAEELVQFSMELNACLATISPDPRARTWFALFRSMDYDGSGLISYYELVRMVRTQLKLKTDVMPVSRLQRIWLSLDKDGSGQLCAGEFGAFMRVGQTFTRVKGVAGAGALKPTPPPPQGESRLGEAAKRRRARVQQRAGENVAAVHGETVARARAVLLPSFRQSAAAQEQEVARLERQLLQLRRGSSARPRGVGGVAMGVALPDIDQTSHTTSGLESGGFQLTIDADRPSTTPADSARGHGRSINTPRAGTIPAL